MVSEAVALEKRQREIERDIQYMRKSVADGKTAAMTALDKLVDEHLASPQGDGLTRPQAFAHVAVRTDQGRSLFAADKRQRGIL